MKTALVLVMALVFAMHPTRPEWYRAILYTPSATTIMTMMARSPTLGFAPEKAKA